ncbi:MAG: hypothetical protein V1709_03865 [Planctomycetota bacterium]
MKEYKISEDLLIQTLNYLAERPFKEVVKLFSQLQVLQLISEPISTEKKE